MTSTRVVVHIEYRAQVGRADQAVTDLETLIATVVATEPDCFAIRLLQDPQDPANLLLIEEWSSQDAYLGPHFQTTHLQAFIARAGEIFEAPPVIQFWFPASEHLREVVPGVGGLA
jgi:quinol monooxygenase YgiN